MMIELFVTRTLRRFADRSLLPAVATSLCVIIKQLADVRLTNNDSNSNVKNANTLLIKLFSFSHFTHLSSVFIKHKNYIQTPRIAWNSYLYNIKAGCYIGEVLLNHLMFADDISLFCPSVRWLQEKLDVCQAYAELHGIIFNCNKTVCVTFKAKSAKSTATPLLKLGGQYVKSVDQYKYVGIILDTELSDDKDIQRQLQYQYCAPNMLRDSFS